MTQYIHRHWNFHEWESLTSSLINYCPIKCILLRELKYEQKCIINNQISQLLKIL